MKITIAQRFHPFSHRIGSKFLLPNSSLIVQVYPTRLHFTDIENHTLTFSVDFSFEGPIKQFTAELDLELGHLKVFGRTQKGFMCYVVSAQKDGIHFMMEKVPQGQINCSHSFSSHLFVLSKGDQWHIPLIMETKKMDSLERLSLGMHKSQEWEAIQSRLDFKEIFPIWQRLSAWMTSKQILSKEGNYSLLETCRQTIESGQKERVLEAFEKFFLSAFEETLIPRLFDTDYQGILPVTPHEKLSTSPLALLTDGAKLIRSLFFKESHKELAILPCLPSQFHCGRMTDVKTLNGHRMDFEWTKKTLRRLRLVAAFEEEIRLKLPKGITSCRVKLGRKTVTHLRIDSKGNMPLELKVNEAVHLDRFC